MHVTEYELITRVTIGWALTFVLGFERAVRGAPAGDRTFSLIGAGTALIGALSTSAPAVLGGAVTGIGFIGGGLCFRQAVQDKEVLHGITTAASIFAAAAIGAAAGVGYVGVAVAASCAVLISLEIRHLPVLRLLDARRWQGRFHHDDHIHFTPHLGHLGNKPNSVANGEILPAGIPSPLTPTGALAANIAAEQIIEASATRDVVH